MSDPDPRGPNPMAFWQHSAQNADGSLLRPRGAPGCLSTLVFVRTGSLKTMLDDQFKEYVTIYGGRLTSAVSGKTSYLVMGQDPGEVKKRTAAEKGVPIISEDGFYDLVRKKTRDAGMEPKEVTYEESLTPLEAGAEIELLDITEKPKVKEKDTIAAPVHFEPRVPQTLESILGNNGVIKDLLDSLKSPGREFALFVYGPTGVGKTLATELILKKLDARVIRLDGSEVRTKSELQSKLHCLLSTSVLDVDTKHKQVVVLVDDAEAVDQGGMTFFNQFLDKFRAEGGRVPFVFITNDPGNRKLKTIKSKSIQIQFKRPATNLIGPYLINVLLAAGIKPDKPAVELIAGKVNGDMRRAMQILQMSVTEKKLDIKEVMRAQRLAMPSDFIEIAGNVLTFARTKAKTLDPYTDIVEQFYSNPLMVYLTLEQNYQSLSSYDVDFCAAASDLLSAADVEMQKMYSQGNWSTSRSAAVMSTILLGFEQCRTRAAAQGFARCGFPGLISLNETLKRYNAQLHDVGLEDVLLSHLDQAEFIEMELTVANACSDDELFHEIAGNLGEDFVKQLDNQPAFDFISKETRQRLRADQGFGKLEKVAIQKARQKKTVKQKTESDSSD